MQRSPLMDMLTPRAKQTLGFAEAQEQQSRQQMSHKPVKTIDTGFTKEDFNLTGGIMQQPLKQTVQAAASQINPGQMQEEGISMVSDFLQTTPAGAAFTVLHGSPKLFEKFSLSKANANQKRAVYGHGLYFTENPEVAGHYAANNGFIYKVDIPDNKTNFFLDWDKPLNEQTDEVISILRNHGVEITDEPGSKLYRRLALGDKINLTKSADRSREASETLNSWGIVGNKYGDNTSEGKYNFVVFDEGLVSILGKETTKSD